MIIIDVKSNESLDKALRRFKKKFEKTGILKQVRKRAFFTKPSVAQRDVIKKATRREAYILEHTV